ncbi:HTH-type transcriptional repressor RspR [Paenibacillus solanacearum]|uniref:HTH-type transcriptional repressor RspR n=1 Tax=Paenibacillus solanacearum TaxID=2048548 RepID=A0A916K303_9BACL|nr:GntR family transcriptional regulator [Paenibacillus solanacearum]CAG7635765.1 HTH-type transcriptional repressor RspR [Paenibacillus solanacearum]
MEKEPSGGTKAVGGAPLLKDVAYQVIKENILEEHFAPGRFLSERELIEFLQMSKTPIKNALVRLETEGFVTVFSKQGIIINDLTIDRITDIYDLRTALETYICTEIAGKMTEAHCELIENNLRKTEEKVKELDGKGFAELDHEFHRLLCECSGNQEIYRVLLNYQDHLLRITLRHLKKDPHRMQQFYQEHVGIYSHLKHGDPRSAELMRAHLQQSKQKLFL